jgi:hypothetical protein
MSQPDSVAAPASAAPPAKAGKPKSSESLLPGLPGAMNAGGGANFFVTLMEIIFGKDFAEQFKDMDPRRVQAKDIISTTIGDLDRLDVKGKDPEAAKQATIATIKKSLETGLEKNGMRFDSPEQRQQFLTQVDKAFKASVDAKSGVFDKNRFVSEMADEAKKLGVDMTTRYEAKTASAAPVAKAPDLMAKPAGEDVGFGCVAEVGPDKLLFSGGKMTVYAMDEHGHLEEAGEVTPTQMGKMLGATSYNVQAVSVGGERQGYFVSNKAGQGYVVGTDAVKLAENPELAARLAQKETPKPSEPGPKPGEPDPGMKMAVAPGLAAPAPSGA